MTSPVVHKLKTHPTAFDAVVAGLKKFEVRKNDRLFQPGDYVELKRLSSRPGEKVQKVTKKIGWMMTGGQYGIAHPRQKLMHLLYAHKDWSLPSIGNLLGGRDHTTILHGIQAYRKRVEYCTDVELVTPDIAEAKGKSDE